MKYNSTNQTTIILRPFELCNINQNILNKLNETIGKCSKDNGYILEINEFEKVGNNFISNVNGYIIYNINYKFTAFKPTIGVSYSTEIEFIYKEGIFTKLNFIKILIPSHFIKEWKFVNNIDDVYYEKGDKKLRTNDFIDIEITSIRYNNHEYQCIAKILEK